MPNNWKTYKLGDLSKEISYGYTESASKKEIGPKFLRITDIQNNFISWENVPYCKISEKHLVKYQLAIGDILVARTGNSTGATALIKDEINAVYASYLIRYRLNEDLVDPRFADYVLRSKKWSNYVDGIKGGSAQPGANAQQFAAFQFVIPPLQEQRAIANILTAIDDKIELNLQQNKTLEEMAMALYKHWFVDFNFPSKLDGTLSGVEGYKSSGGEFVESELGKIPKGWEVKRVNDFGIVKTGKTPSKKYPEHFGEEIPFVTPTDFKNYGKHITNASRGVSELGIQKHKNSIVKENSVIVTCIGSDMGKVALSKVRSLTNQQINSLVTDFPMFMYCFFKSNYKLLKLLAGDGTTMPIINKSSFENIEVIAPEKKVLLEFEAKISIWDDQMLLSSQENQTLTKLRDTLLPKLISGEVRVKDIEETVSQLI